MLRLYGKQHDYAESKGIFAIERYSLLAKYTLHQAIVAAFHSSAVVELLYLIDGRIADAVQQMRIIILGHRGENNL